MSASLFILFISWIYLFLKYRKNLVYYLIRSTGNFPKIMTRKSKTRVIANDALNTDRLTKYNVYIKRLIPQGTVDNNLGPDRLTGPKALDPNYCRQPTLWLHDLCLQFLILHGNELRLFGTKAQTIKVGYLTLQQYVQLLTSLAMTRLGPSIGHQALDLPRTGIEPLPFHAERMHYVLFYPLLIIPLLTVSRIFCLFLRIFVCEFCA